MGISLTEMFLHAMQIIQRRSSSAKHRYHRQSLANHEHHVVPKGHFAVYVGEEFAEKKRFVVPILYLKHPLFQELLFKAAEEFGFDHQRGAINIPCAEEDFINLISYLNSTMYLA